MKRLSIPAITGRNPLHEECANLVRLLRFSDGSNLVWEVAQDCSILDHDDSASVLLNQLLLMDQIVFECSSERSTDHSQGSTSLSFSPYDYIL